MRKGLLVPVTMVLCVLSVAVTPAGAVGLGLYIEGGGGSADWEAEDDYSYDFEFETDNARGGVGFVLDTAVARDQLFNYRLQVGYEKWVAERKSGQDLDLRGGSMTHDFGFGVLRSPYVRLWLGPELKLAYLTGSPDGNNQFDVALFRYGVGPVMGANFNLGGTVTLALKAGFLFEGFVGVGENDYSNYDETYTGSSTEFYINLAILFRIDDVF